MLCSYQTADQLTWHYFILLRGGIEIDHYDVILTNVLLDCTEATNLPNQEYFIKPSLQVTAT